MKNIRVRLIVAIMLLIYAITNALFGILLGSIIDVVISNAFMNALKYLGITLACLAMNSISGLLAWKTAYSDGRDQLVRIKEKRFDADASKERSEEIDLTLYTDKSTYLLDKYFMAKWEIVYNILLAVAAILALIHINWIMCVVAVVVSALPMLVPKLMGKRISANAKDFAQNGAKYSNLTRDYLNGRYEWRKYGNEVGGQIKSRFHQQNYAYENSRAKNEFGIYKAQVSTGVLGNIGFIVVFGVGALLSVKGIITAGSIVSVIQLLNYLVGPLSRAAGAKNRVVAAKPVLEEFMKKESDDKQTGVLREVGNLGDKALEVSNLNIIYGTNPVIEQASLLLLKGKKYILNGRSGSGKTSLARALSECLCGASGNIKTKDLNSVRYIEQQPYIFHCSVIDNVTMYRDEYKEEAYSLLKQFGLDYLDYDAICEEETLLSGGERYRISLVRGLIDRPDVLIVDEPTAALDGENARIVFEYLMGLDETVLVITHEDSAYYENKVDSVIEISEHKVKMLEVG
ncbi:MAG: ABC transporter ATP-binding protein/permease [Lachnospiraceae bacterium]|nr:ABC transporter ATP-binding protein/permease [Lachnospiraceae bacterium]